MKAQEIYLSPKNILSYLTDFEKRLPRKKFVESKSDYPSMHYRREPQP